MKGICFKEPLFKSTIEEIKDMTRRIVPQKEGYVLEMVDYKQYKGLAYITPNVPVVNLGNGRFKHTVRTWHPCKPKYKVGERIYLKEPYSFLAGCPATGDIYLYKFDGAKCFDEDGWKNKLFMPESAARYFIEITGVRAERLQDISEEDCLREGIRKVPYTTGDGNTYYSYWNGISNEPKHNSKKGELFHDECCSGICSKWTEEEAARIVFSRLIDNINGKGTWESNPFVWVYEFKLLK